MLERAEILGWLRESDPGRLDELRRAADASRRAAVGDAVHLRGLVEISSHCVRHCAYCGLRAPNRAVGRYRLGRDEIVAAAAAAVRVGCGTVVLQSGDDPGLEAGAVAELVRAIRDRSGPAVTLSLGERLPAELALWREAGAARYLLRFESSNRALLRRFHPPLPGETAERRFELLRTLRELGYEVGSGALVGLPGQSWDDLAEDIATFGRLDLDMIGIGPFIPHPATPLGAASVATLAPEQQVRADVDTALRTMALARLVCPQANIPATTAVATLDPARGYERALAWGANVIMPNLTPRDVAAAYEIYPGRARGTASREDAAAAVRRRIEGAGRTVGCGSGGSPNWRRRLGGRSAAGAPDRVPPPDRVDRVGVPDVEVRR